MTLQLVLFLTAVMAAVAVVCGDSSIDEDAKLNVTGLLTKYGYPYEVHEVQTEDGYLLTMHRITGGKGQAAPGDRPQVFLMHGLFSSSADWIVMGPQNGFGYILADQGFDVWMGNARGNTYSRKHATLNPDKDSKFWKFSWNEIGYYDLPAMIDYVLAKTGKTKLHYAGHSQGTTSFFVMCALRKEYNSKIKLMHALAPIAYMSHLKSPLMRILAKFSGTLDVVTSLIGADELMPSTKLMKIASDLLCKDHSLMQPVCSSILFLLVGNDPELLNKTMLPVIFGHTPAGSSARQVVHYGQEIESAKFRKFDFGLRENRVEYKQDEPPSYSLKDITAPVALHYSDNDYLAHPTDVGQLSVELGNQFGMFKVPNEKFNHLDFLWAINVRPLLYDLVIKQMKDNN